MSAAVKWEIYDQIRIDDPSPELREQWHWLVDRLFDLDPTVGEKIREQEARKMLRRMLARRSLAVSPQHEARIDACADLAVLERWIDQAVTAASTDEALA